jgi:hypothetical protein
MRRRRFRLGIYIYIIDPFSIASAATAAGKAFPWRKKKEKRRDVYCISLILISYNNSNQMCPRSYTYIYKDATWMPGATHMQLLLPSPTGFENNHLHSRSFHTPSPLSTGESSIFLVTSREINKRWFTIFLANDATENKKRSFGL